MKTILLLLLLAFSGFQSHGQIVLENSYSGDIKFINLSNSGFKFSIVDKINQQLKLYNLDHSFWKTISIPVPSGYSINSVHYISEELFDNDTTIELLILFSKSYPFSVQFDILNEDGSILMNLINDSNISGYSDPSLIFDGNYFRLVVSIDTLSNIYSLPGSFPCGPCSGTITGMGVINDMEKKQINNPYPNPSKNYILIPYSLPNGVKTGEIVIYDIAGKKIKSFIVDNTFQSLHVATDDFQSGTYSYALQTKEGIIVSKKVIIIK